MTERELALRRAIMESFAASGAPPAVSDASTLRRLAEQHVVVLEDGTTAIRMAHPFAALREGARVEAGGRTWWGNCAWDGLGIVAALGLTDATVASHAVTLRVRDATPDGDALFHVAVPAAEWWADIGDT